MFVFMLFISSSRKPREEKQALCKAKLENPTGLGCLNTAVPKEQA
jgi:hypothetical protein